MAPDHSASDTFILPPRLASHSLREDWDNAHFPSSCFSSAFQSPSRGVSPLHFRHHTEDPCHFTRLPYDIRLCIYELVLEIDKPRKVFIKYDQAWKDTNLSRAEKILHAAKILKEEEKQGMYLITLQEYSRDEVKHMTRTLWPSVLRVSREIRAETLELFYRKGKFYASDDPFTVPEWEARLPLEALRCLATNANLELHHICGELQQWKCLRKYLYNPDRQLYQVSDAALVEKYWGPDEAVTRRKLKSIPWKFQQKGTIKSNKLDDEELGDDELECGKTPCHPNFLLEDDNYGLHECLHHECREEYDHLMDIEDRASRDIQLRRFAAGLKQFFAKLKSKRRLTGIKEVHDWLAPWLRSPLGPFPSRLPYPEYHGGLFIGVGVNAQDQLTFLNSLRQNARNAHH